MIESWVIDRLNPLKSEKLVILADPQRMIRAGARAVDGWANESGFAVLFCTGNLGLRELYENLPCDLTAKLILVDRTRDKAKLPLFYPDLEARCKPRARLKITLRDFLTEKTGDQRWPLLVNTDRNIGRLILENLPQALQAHAQLRDVDEHRFTDSDLYEIVLGATLGINPFHKLSAGEIRRLLERDAEFVNEVIATLRRARLCVIRRRRRAAPNQSSGNVAPHARVGKRIDGPSTMSREVQQTIIQRLVGLAGCTHRGCSCVRLFTLQFALSTFHFAFLMSWATGAWMSTEEPSFPELAAGC